MMGRRLLLLVAVLMGLTALAASIAPRQTATDDTATPGRPGTAVRPSATRELAPAQPAPKEENEIEETLSAAKGASPVRIRARPGQTLRLDVQGKLFDEVVLDGLDQVEAIAPEAPAHFELYMDQPGRFEIKLLGTGRRLGEILVRD